MSVERAAAIESINRRRLPESSNSSSNSMKLRIAEHPVRDRVQSLVDLAFSLLRETENLARDKAFTEASTSLRSFDLEKGIDFYKEVQQFEIELIKLALDHTRGSQVRAARLLAIKPTTLNSKIKLYGIEY